MKVWRLLLVFLGLILAACAQDGNSDSPSEVSCSSATGTWTITSATCDGASATVEPIALLFNSATSVTQSQGSADCASTMAWDIVHGDFDNSLEMTGSGNLSCTANGSSVATCSGSSNSCDSSTDVSGMINNFETCALSGSSMTLSRTVSGTNQNGSTFCSDGQLENIVLTQSATATLAVLDISGADPADFGSHSTGSSNQMTLTLTNSGQADASAIAASGLAAPFSFFGGSYPGTGGTCAASLTAGATCTMVVSFDPTASGSFNDSIVIDYNDSSAAQQLNHGLTGTGVSGSVAILNISESDPYDFGTTPLGGFVNHTFTISNSGSGTATSMTEIGLAAPFQFMGGVYPGTGGDCGATLAAGASCNISLQFSPFATGLFADTIEISYNNGSSTQTATRDVMGTGVTPALLIISETDPYDFGAVSTSSTASHMFTVTNTGGSTAVGIFESGLAAPFGFQGGAYPGVTGTCSVFLAPGASCTLDVQFAPTVNGVQNDTISIGYNDGAAAQLATRAVTGTGTP